MKNNYLTILIVMIISINTFAQNVPNYVSTNGLVGYWPFNGNANDESGNGNNGTVNGATLTTDKNGISNRAYSFNNSFINVANNQSLQFNNQITVSLWVKTNTFPSPVSYFLSKGKDHDAINNSWICYLSTSGTGSFGIGDCELLFSSFQNNSWSNIVMTQDGITRKIFFNGILKNTISCSNSIFSNTYDLQFGKMNNLSWPYYLDGKLDDIAIYNRALTNEEITALYTGIPPCSNPTATITPQGNTNLCQGGSVLLNASTGTNYTYEWYKNGNIINGEVTSSYLASTAANYTVKVIDGACNTTSTATQVIVNSIPSNLVNASGNTTFCQGGSVTLTAQGVGTYLWSNGSINQSITATQNGNYSVVTTNNGCSSTSSLNSVTVNPLPIATITPSGNTTFCQGGSVLLNSSTGTNYTYEWYKDGNIINGEVTSSYLASTAANYTVKVIDGACNTTSTATQVIVNSIPSNLVNASGNTTFCQGGSVTLTAQGVGTYLWSNGSINQSITATQNGNYSVVTTNNGCSSTSTLNSVTVNPLPIATITPSGTTTFCQGGAVNLVASGGSNYLWNTGSQSNSISADQNSTYSVSVMNQYNCQAEASQVVTVNPKPVVTLNTFNNVVYKTSAPIQLIGNPSGGTYVGENVIGSIFTPAKGTLGKKIITYNYTSLQGCSGSVSQNTIIADTVGNVCSTYDTLKIKVKFTLGLYANTINTIKFYPNPTNDILNIDNGNFQAMTGYSIKIVSLTGAVVYNQPITSQQVQISMNQFATKGLYIAQIVDSSNIIVDSKKIILE